MVWYNVYAISFTVPYSKAPTEAHTALFIAPEDLKSVDVVPNPDYQPTKGSLPQQSRLGSDSASNASHQQANDHHNEPTNKTEPRYLIRVPKVYFIEYHGLVYDSAGKLERKKMSATQRREALYYISKRHRKRLGQHVKAKAASRNIDMGSQGADEESGEEYVIGDYESAYSAAPFAESDEDSEEEYSEEEDANEEIDKDMGLSTHTIQAPKAMAMPEWLRQAIDGDQSQEMAKTPLQQRMETEGTPEYMFLHSGNVKTTGESSSVTENVEANIGTGYPITGYILLGRSQDPQGILLAAESVCKFLRGSADDHYSNNTESPASLNSDFNDETDPISHCGVGPHASKLFINSVIETTFHQHIFWPVEKNEEEEMDQVAFGFLSSLKKPDNPVKSTAFSNAHEGVSVSVNEIAVSEETDSHPTEVSQTGTVSTLEELDSSAKEQPNSIPIVSSTPVASSIPSKPHPHHHEHHHRHFFRRYLNTPAPSSTAPKPGSDITLKLPVPKKERNQNSTTPPVIKESVPVKTDSQHQNNSSLPLAFQKPPLNTPTSHVYAEPKTPTSVSVPVSRHGAATSPSPSPASVSRINSQTFFQPQEMHQIPGDRYIRRKPNAPKSNPVDQFNKHKPHVTNSGADPSIPATAPNHGADADFSAPHSKNTLPSGLTAGQQSSLSPSSASPSPPNGSRPRSSSNSRSRRIFEAVANKFSN